MTLYEYFNTTNQTVPHFERHQSFVMDITPPDCGAVMSLDYAERCDHVTAPDSSCGEDVFILDYMELLFCTLDPRTEVVFYGVGLTLLLICAFYLFIMLGAAADGFFCPGLKMVSKMLGLSENVAGVTLLALGNGAPDLFTGFAGLGTDTRQLYSDVYSSGMFVVFIVGGLVIALKPFTLPLATTARDICFLLLDVLFVEYAIKSNNSVTVTEAVLILLIYISFIFCVFADQFLLKQASKSLEKKGSLQALSAEDLTKLHKLKSEASFALTSKTSRIKDPGATLYDPSHGKNHRLFQQFFITLSPIDLESWAEKGFCMRVLTILVTPIRTILRIFIPVVDDDMPIDGWSKLLNCLQLVILPGAMTWIIYPGDDDDLLGPYNAVIVSIIMLPFAVWLFWVTRVDQKPKYHKYFAVLSVIGSVYSIYALANECVSVLGVIGITTYRSNSFLGCSMLAWGNSIGDLLSNLSLARHGFQKMSFAACFGGPLLNSLLAIGGAYLFMALSDPTLKYKVAPGTFGVNNFYFMLIGITTVLIAVSTTNCVLRRCIGIIMMFWYVFYLFILFMGEMEVIHTYGSDHRMDKRAELAE